jgi:hypothetical protein
MGERLMTLREAIDLLSLNGLSWGLPKQRHLDRPHVVLYSGENRAVYFVDTDEWLTGDKRGKGLGELIEGLRPLRLAA